MLSDFGTLDLDCVVTVWQSRLLLRRLTNAWCYKRTTPVWIHPPV